jgi:hypothetical protein
VSIRSLLIRDPLLHRKMINPVTCRKISTARSLSLDASHFNGRRQTWLMKNHTTYMDAAAYTFQKSTSHSVSQELRWSDSNGTSASNPLRVWLDVEAVSRRTMNDSRTAPQHVRLGDLTRMLHEASRAHANSSKTRAPLSFRRLWRPPAVRMNCTWICHAAFGYFAFTYDNRGWIDLSTSRFDNVNDIMIAYWRGLEHRRASHFTTFARQYNERMTCKRCFIIHQFPNKVAAMLNCKFGRNQWTATRREAWPRKTWAAVWRHAGKQRVVCVMGASSLVWVHLHSLDTKMYSHSRTYHENTTEINEAWNINHVTIVRSNMETVRPDFASDVRLRTWWWLSRDMCYNLRQWNRVSTRYLYVCGFQTASRTWIR